MNIWTVVIKLAGLVAVSFAASGDFPIALLAGVGVAMLISEVDITDDTKAPKKKKVKK